MAEPGKKDSKELIRILKEKAGYLTLKEGTRIRYGICAISVNGKTALQKEGVFVLDLEDIGKVLDKSGKFHL
ncbi:hypothetical protein [Methanolobus sp. WCC5]|uniref:hypothetical protein n=1 Tax=Methanolobus sp. WCC5 TaxID=3125785 RepID=UPI003248F3B7